ncbi:MAG: hypothetical protein ACTSP1_02875 [Candidatus Freyarchaeota archaeon]
MSTRTRKKNSSGDKHKHEGGGLKQLSLPESNRCEKMVDTHSSTLNRRTLHRTQKI